jgi:DNA-binding LytR/AlgR family response regulator
MDMTCDEGVTRGPRGFWGRGGHKKNLPFLAAEGAAPDAFRRLKAIAEEVFESVFIELKLGSDDGVAVIAKLQQHPPSLAVVR